MRDTLQDIYDAAEALCDGREHSEPRYLEDGHGALKPTKPHKTIVPGLIEQLRQAAEPGADGETGGRGGPESVPVAIDAVSLLASIAFGAAKRVGDARRVGIRVDRRDTPEGDIRALVGVAARLPATRTRVEPYRCPTCADGIEHWAPCHHCQPTTQGELAGELTAWQRQAEVITGWRTAAKALLAPCPMCEARGTLLASPDPADLKAWCIGCEHFWCEDPGENEGHIGLLARHVMTYQDMTHEERREYRRAAVEARQRSEGRSSPQAA